MHTNLLRASATILLCTTLTGCGGTFGKIGAGLAAAAVTTIFNAALSSGGSKHERARAAASTPVAVVPAGPSYPDQDPTLRSCPAKRAEFLAVYQGARRLPAQLECTAEGDWGGAALLGAHPDSDDGVIAARGE